MQNLNSNYRGLSIGETRMLGLKIKTLKNINSCVSYTLSVLVLIAIIEFVRFCFDLYAYLH